MRRPGIGCEQESGRRCGRASRRSPEEVRAPGLWRCRTDRRATTRWPSAPAAQVSNTAAGSTLCRSAQIAKQASAGVVEVDATSTSSQSPFPGSSSESAAEGTGFVYDAKGDIVTNEHVVDGASTVRVKLSDGSTYKATVVGKDTSTDIAVLHIDAPPSKLTPLALGDSSALVGR